MCQNKTMLKCTKNDANQFRRLKIWTVKCSGLLFLAHPLYLKSHFSLTGYDDSLMFLLLLYLIFSALVLKFSMLHVPVLQVIMTLVMMLLFC